MKYWAVVGQHNTRKSSTIYSLAGTGKIRRAWELNVNGDVIIAYVDPRSAQERPQLHHSIDLVNAIKDARHHAPALSHALLAFHHTNSNAPSGIDYMAEMKAQGWECIGALFTSPNPTTEMWIKENHPMATISSSPSKTSPGNEIANTVRGIWGL